MTWNVLIAIQRKVRPPLQAAARREQTIRRSKRLVEPPVGCRGTARSQDPSIQHFRCRMSNRGRVVRDTRGRGFMDPQALSRTFPIDPPAFELNHWNGSWSWKLDVPHLTMDDRAPLTTDFEATILSHAHLWCEPMQYLRPIRTNITRHGFNPHGLSTTRFPSLVSAMTSRQINLSPALSRCFRYRYFFSSLFNSTAITSRNGTLRTVKL